MVLIIFQKKKKKIQVPQTVVGVCGMTRGVGTTNFSLCLANYFRNKCLESTCYVEFNSTKQICELNGGISKKFSYKGIDFFPDEKLHNLPNLLNLHYSYYVLDFGVCNSYNVSEFERCTDKFAVCNLSPWKIQQFNSFIKKYENVSINFDNLHILGNPAISQYDKALQRKIHYDIEPVPFFPNPFQITSENFSFFNKLLERN